MNKTKTNSVPTLTTEERMAALDKALEARKKRSSALQELKQGKISVEDLLNTQDECLRRIKIYDLLRVYKGIGERKAPRIMEELGIAQSRRIGGLGWKQKEKLLVFVAKYTNK